jgi:hypothetical protein
MFLVTVTISPFYCKNTTLLPNSCRITCSPLVSIFFCSIVAVYDYKFYNHLHLVIVIYLPVHFYLCQELQITNKEVWSNMWNFYHGNILFYSHLHITTGSYGVSRKDRLEWMEVVLICYLLLCGFKCYLLLIQKRRLIS